MHLLHLRTGTYIYIQVPRRLEPSFSFVYQLLTYADSCPVRNSLRTNAPSGHWSRMALGMAYCKSEFQRLPIAGKASSRSFCPARFVRSRFSRSLKHSSTLHRDREYAVHDIVFEGLWPLDQPVLLSDWTLLQHEGRTGCSDLDHGASADRRPDPQEWGARTRACILMLTVAHWCFPFKRSFKSQVMILRLEGLGMPKDQHTNNRLCTRAEP